MESKKIVHVSAGISHSSVPYRLMNAFHSIGLDSEIVTAQSSIENLHIHIVQKSLLHRILRKLDYWRWQITKQKYPHRKVDMPFSSFYVGMNLSKNEYVKAADTIVIHWTGANFLSTYGIEKILKMEKQVLVVCHDNGHFTGGCHVRMGCEKYQEQCGMCPQLGSNEPNDWSYKMLEKRKRLYQDKEVLVVSPSRWMDGNVERSAVFQGQRHMVIPNPIDVEVFCPGDRRKLRENMEINEGEIVILFGAINAVSSPYKGYDKLLEALSYFTKKYKSIGPITAYVFGQGGETYQFNEQFKLRFLGYLQEEEMVSAYRMADVYVVPSLEDSFNNTVAEAMSTETPVVSFATGGIVDIIDHKVNGYLAEYGNASDLAEGLYWIIKNNAGNCLGMAGRKKIKNSFSYEAVAKKYKNIMNNVLI